MRKRTRGLSVILTTLNSREDLGFVFEARRRRDWGATRSKMMKTVKTWNKKTAQQIIAGADGEANDCSNMTGDVLWHFARVTNPDGTLNDSGPYLASEENADCIIIDSRGGALAHLEI